MTNSFYSSDASDKSRKEGADPDPRNDGQLA